MQANPIWQVKDRFPKLENDTEVDVAVIGGGMAGISCAHFLKQAGYRVAVLEEDEVGNAASGASSGILAYGSGTGFVEAAEMWGKENATLLWKETQEVIKSIQKVVEKKHIRCDARAIESIMVAKEAKDKQLLEDEHVALNEIGMKATRLVPTEFIKKVFPGREFAAGLLFEETYQIMPAQFAAGLAQAYGIEVYEKSGMQSFKETDKGVVVKTADATVTCKHMLVATNLKPMFGLEKHYEIESSMIFASQKLAGDMEKVFPQKKILWTTDLRYDLFYPHDGRAIFEVYSPKDKEQKLKLYFPNFDYKIEKQWGDSWSKAKDWLPIVGKVKPNISVALAMGDQGITMSWMSARKIASVIKGESDPLLEMMSPKRFED